MRSKTINKLVETKKRKKTMYMQGTENGPIGLGVGVGGLENARSWRQSWHDAQRHDQQEIVCYFVGVSATQLYPTIYFSIYSEKAGGFVLFN